MSCKCIFTLFTRKFTIFTLAILFTQTGYAQQNRPEIFYPNPNLPKEKISYDAELSLEAQQDQLRPTNNPNRTQIRNLSLGLNFKDDTTLFRFEILGEQNQLSNDINLNVGEVYISSKIQNVILPTQIFAGATKLEYGLLNDLDGVLSFLPSYYNILYDLPRGIDTGVGLNTFLFNQKLSLSSFVFLGRNLRQQDAQNQRLDVAPHHLKLSFNDKDYRISLNYFSRKYEAQALIQGVGLEFAEWSQSFFNSWLKINFNAEVFALQTSLNGIQTNGYAGLINPELELGSILFRSILALESWTQDGQSSQELFSTVGLGYRFNKNLHAYFERSEISNLTNSLVKEESLQFRLISQWAL